MFPHLVVRTLLAMTLGLVSACSATSPEIGGRAPELTALPRPLAASEIRISSAANDFSFSLFRAISAAQRDSSVFVSPLSASMALGMTMNGAAGTTYDQMRQALAFGDASEADINAGYKNLVALLRGLDPGVDIRIANSIWYRAGFPVNQSFLDASRSWFDADAKALDFSSASSVPTINGWVSAATNGKIPRVIDEIRADHVMFLINAIYFKGSWRDRFDAARTRDESFRATGGTQAVRMMHRTGTMRYASQPDYEVVELPYGNGAFNMTVLLPREGRSVETIAASLQAGSWPSVVSSFHEAHVELSLPRFKVEWGRTLNDDLQALGMRDAFNPTRADFTRLSPRGRELFIDFVKQQAYVDVNEEGTEAAAATTVGISLTSAPVSIPFKVDRPFIFVIRERFSGTLLFMGKIVRIP